MRQPILIGHVYEIGCRYGKLLQMHKEDVIVQFVDHKFPKTGVVLLEYIGNKCESYWFFNSMFEVCITDVISDNRKKEMLHRQSIGNYFQTKYECFLKVEEIKKLLTQK